MAGEALIRVRLAEVCATDLQLLAGYKGGYRSILGHEFVGEVVAAPGYEGWLGRALVREINIGCGVCELCQRGLSKHCRQRQVWVLSSAMAPLPIMSPCRWPIYMLYPPH